MTRATLEEKDEIAPTPLLVQEEEKPNRVCFSVVFNFPSLEFDYVRINDIVLQFYNQIC